MTRKLGAMKLKPRYVLAIILLLAITTLMYVKQMSFMSWITFREPIDVNKCPGFETGNKTASNSSTNDSISLFVRMAGKLPEYRRRFYCLLLRTSVLYWPASYGKLVVVLDLESEQDHEFAANLTRQIKQHFPDRKIEVAFESLPNDPSVLDFSGSPKSPGYNRQLWSSFFIDLYTNDSIIAWMDTDNAFATPVTKASIFNVSKVRILGSECSLGISWVKTWASTTESALGLPMVADYMTYFPVYLYRDTFTNCRKHILKRFNTCNFEEAFKKFYHGYLSPVSIVISYAWYFERDRYDWNMKVCSDLTQYNSRFSAGHKIGSEHVVSILSEPQTVFHVHYAEDVVSSTIVASYCLSHEAAGNATASCSNYSALLNNNLVLFNQDLQRVNFTRPPCPGNYTKTSCLQVLERHYKEVGLEIKQNERKLDWHDLETVEKLAHEVGIDCKAIR